MAIVNIRVKRFDKISGEFSEEVQNIINEWGFDTVRNIKTRLITGPKPISKGRLKDTIRHELKGGIKKVRKNKKQTQVQTIIVQFKAGSGDTPQDNTGGRFPGVPYAQRQEKGGVAGIVSARTATKIWVPFNDKDRGLGQFYKASGNTIIINNLVFLKGSDGKKEGPPIAVLKIIVSAPANPYMLPTIKAGMPELKKRLKAIRVKGTKK